MRLGGAASGMVRWLYGRPYLLLTLTSMSWASNVIAGRLAVDRVSPMAVVTLRWLIVVTLLFLFASRQIRGDLPLLRARWRWIVVLGTVGYTAFNALFYVAAHHTTGVSLGILQATMPAFILIGGLIVYGTRVRLVQAAGVVLTLGGAALVASRGDLTVLRTLAFNAGDILILTASALYAGYATFLARRPRVAAVSLFAGMASAAFISSLPLLALEYAAGSTQWPTTSGWLVVVHIAVIPSLLAQLFFMRGIELIGPGRAGIFTNLVPILAALFSVLLLGEPLEIYHAYAFALVLGGIWLAERGRGTSAIGARPDVSK